MARKCYPSLHLKTHFKGATSVLMEDTNAMKIEKGGEAEDLLKLAVEANNEDVLEEQVALKKHLSGKYGLL